MFIQPANYDAIASCAIAHGTSISPLTEDGLVSIRDYGIAYVDKPLQYGVNDSWAYFFFGILRFLWRRGVSDSYDRKALCATC